MYKGFHCEKHMSQGELIQVCPACHGELLASVSLHKIELAEKDSQIASLTKERDDWKKQYKTLNHELMCELRDPCGTIWEHAKKQQDEIASMTEEVKKGMKQALLNEGLRKEIAALKELVRDFITYLNRDVYIEEQEEALRKRAKEALE